MTKQEILSVTIHRFWDSSVPITYHIQDMMTDSVRLRCSSPSQLQLLLWASMDTQWLLQPAAQVCSTQRRSAILTHLAASGHHTAVMQCLPCEWEVFLCRPVPAHPLCLTCTHRHILNTEVIFNWPSSCNSTGHLLTSTVTWNNQMVNPSHSNCWTAFTFYSRTITHSLVFTSVKHPQIIRYLLLTVHKCNNCFIKFVGWQCLQFIITNKKLGSSVTTPFTPRLFAGVA